MKRAYAASKYTKPCEAYCRKHYPDEAEAILRRAEDYYRDFMRDMPDLGENMMAKNMLDWFTILAFYEASDRRMDGETLLEIKRLAVERLRFLGRLVDGNKSRWLYRLFEKTYVRFRKMQKKHQARGEWMDSWRVEINPDHRTEGFCFHLVGCPIAKHAREHGYTATRSCCRICAGRTISLRRSCTRALSGRRPRRSAARAAITGMWAIGARRCGTMRSCRRSERKKGKSAGQGVPVPRSFAAFARKERKSLHLPQQSGSMTKE